MSTVVLNDIPQFRINACDRPTAIRESTRNVLFIAGSIYLPTREAIVLDTRAEIVELSE